MRRVEKFEAFDGELFPSESACNAYERENAPRILAERSLDEIEAAIARADLTLATAIEEVARRIKRVRLAKCAPTMAYTEEGALSLDPDADAGSASVDEERAA